MPPVLQPTNAPTTKVQASTGAGAAAAVLAWLLQTFTEVEVPPGIEAAVAVLIGSLAAYFVRERTPDREV